MKYPMKNKDLPQLSFDTSGSARIRFFGKIAKVAIHYAKAKVPMTHMICPDSILGTCLLCQKGIQPSPRLLSIGVDCNKQKWAIYMGTPNGFKAIYKQCQAIGISSAVMEAGDGPDVLLQRVGPMTEPEILLDTIGQSRIPADKSWDADSEVGPAIAIPNMDDILKSLATRSHWNLLDSVEELAEMYPKISGDMLEFKFIQHLAKPKEELMACEEKPHVEDDGDARLIEDRWDMLE